MGQKRNREPSTCALAVRMYYWQVPPCTVRAEKASGHQNQGLFLYLVRISFPITDTKPGGVGYKDGVEVASSKSTSCPPPTCATGSIRRATDECQQEMCRENSPFLSHGTRAPFERYSHTHMALRRLHLFQNPTALMRVHAVAALVASPTTEIFKKMKHCVRGSHLSHAQCLERARTKRIHMFTHRELEPSRFAYQATETTRATASSTTMRHGGRSVQHACLL